MSLSVYLQQVGVGTLHNTRTSNS